MDFTQYQHYVPQFMLRRFSMDQPINPSKGSKSDRKREKDRHKYTCTVKVLNLRGILPHITDDLVRKTFGRRGMYNDGLDNRIEKKLANIEQNVSPIIKRVVDAHEAGNGGISLLRYEKDLLRKFQFVMRYRSPIFFRRFNHQTAKDYNSDDKKEFRKYMRDNAFSRPIDVWFDNIQQIIDSPMDPAGNWAWGLLDRIYPPDALWLAQNIRSMYMAFVTPSDPQEEFILTENAFGIHEGPVSYTVDGLTRDAKQTAYTEFHLLTVISPRLAIVFRSGDMPEPLEDLIPGVREQKLAMLAAIAQRHADPKHAKSLLEDLPIAKARNSYTTVNNGLLELAEGADGEPEMNDKFDFVFFRLESKHVQTINMVMLDQAYDIDKLVFKSEAALLKAIEYYLEYPCLTRGLYSMKTVSSKTDDPRLGFLKRMENVARGLGSSATAKYHVDPLREDDEAMPLEIAVAQVLATTTDTPEKDPIVLGTEILMNTLRKTKTNITVKNESDQIEDSLPVFPDTVYRCIQQACRENPGQPTNYLLKIDRRSLVLSWVRIFSAAIGNSENGDVAATREKLRQFVNNMYAETSQESETLMKPASGSSSQAPMSQQDSSSGFSRQGLTRAFEDIGRYMEREETPSSAQSLANQSFSHSMTDFVESKEESYPAQRPEKMEPKGDVSLDDALTVAPVVLPNNRYRDITPLDWKLNIFFFVFLMPALPLMWLAFTLVFRALVIVSFVCAPTWLAFHKGALDVLHDRETFPTHLKSYILYMFCTILWWFACYWFWLPDMLPTELPSGLTVACLLVSVINGISSRPDPW